MVLSAATENQPLGIQPVAMCSVGTAIGTMGIVLAIATASQANTLHTTDYPLETLAYPSSQQDYAQSEQLVDSALIEASANRAGLERLRARLLSPQKTTEAAPPAHGTYLYGQQPIADQPETAYFVFESHGTNIAGALYMPSSSFDCVQGQIVDQQIALSITDSYSQATYSYALALNEPLVEVASQSGIVTSPPNINGFYPLPLREQDRAILATCQTS